MEKIFNTIRQKPSAEISKQLGVSILAASRFKATGHLIVDIAKLQVLFNRCEKHS